MRHWYAAAFVRLHGGPLWHMDGRETGVRMPGLLTMTTVADTPALPAEPDRVRRMSLKSMLVAVLIVLAAVAGYAWGSHRNGVVELHGSAYSTPAQIGVTAGGIAYNVPLDLPWLGTDGTWNLGGRPACLPASSKHLRVTFGAVKWEHSDMRGYTVAWVDCSH
jgi:hypothetical protein